MNENVVKETLPNTSDINICDDTMTWQIILQFHYSSIA